MTAWAWVSVLSKPRISGALDWGVQAASGSEGGDGEHVPAAVGGVAGDVAFIGHVAELLFHV